MFANARLDIAFDELFDQNIEINVDKLKIGLSRVMTEGTDFNEGILAQFIHYVSFHPDKHYFTKTKFVAAISHIIIRLRPEIAAQFKVKNRPGMPSYNMINPMVEASQN